MTDRDVGIRDSSTSAGRAGSFSTVTFRMGVCVLTQALTRSVDFGI